MMAPSEVSETVQDEEDYAETLRRERLSIAEQLAVLVVRAHRRTVGATQTLAGPESSATDKVVSSR